jgi:hypothetical protein
VRRCDPEPGLKERMRAAESGHGVESQRERVLKIVSPGSLRRSRKRQDGSVQSGRYGGAYEDAGVVIADAAAPGEFLASGRS